MITIKSLFRMASRSWIKILAVMIVGACFSISSSAQKVAVKTNLAHWGVLASPNGAVEVKLANHWTVDLYGGFNFWQFNNGETKTKHWMVQPEFRYWFCEAFTGTFIGLHGHGGQYNIGGVDLPVGRLKNFKEHRYQGPFYGAGLSIGHQWILSPHWSIEASLGGGWARTPYRKYPCAECGSLLSEGTYDYFGVTRGTLSLIYVIK